MVIMTNKKFVTLGIAAIIIASAFLLILIQEQKNSDIKTVEIKLPIDNKEEAVAYANLNSNYSEFTQYIKDSFDTGVLQQAIYDESLDYWYVTVHPNYDEIKDVGYSVVFMSDGALVSEGPMRV